MIHNQVASVVALAKSELMAARGQENYTIRGASFELIVNTLIDLADHDNPTARKIESASAAFVAGRVTGVEGR